MTLVQLFKFCEFHFSSPVKYSHIPILKVGIYPQSIKSVHSYEMLSITINFVHITQYGVKPFFFFFLPHIYLVKVVRSVFIIVFFFQAFFGMFFIPLPPGYIIFTKYIFNFLYQ